MVNVEYRYQYEYRYLGDERFPIIQLTITNPADLTQSIDVDAYIDSGAERSIFNGFVIPVIGLELLNGGRKEYSPTAGSAITAYLHRVRFGHPDLGTFDLEVGFSDVQLRRNLLGRDFFNLFQIGFRENQLLYFLDANP